MARRPLLLDAAMGTRLIARGLDPRRDDPALWNLSRPAEVARVHALDVEAGADAVLTNTFGANRAWLDRLGRAGEVAAINRQAVALAREAAGPGRYVLGGLGPTADWHHDGHAEQAGALLDAGVDALLLETHSAEEALRALGRLDAVARVPILVALRADAWYSGGAGAPRFRSGLARMLESLGASAVGVNCLPVGEALALLADLQGSIDLPLIAEPHGSRPGEAADPPEVLAAAVPDLVARGARLLGTCCGSDERHVAALRAALDPLGDATPA